MLHDKTFHIQFDAILGHIFVRFTCIQWYKKYENVRRFYWKHYCVTLGFTFLELSKVILSYLLTQYDRFFSGQHFPQICIYFFMVCLTAPFNNMRTLKFKIQPTITLFTAVNHCSGPRRKQNVWLNRVKRSYSCAVIGGFRSTFSVSVYFWSVACRGYYD